MSRSPAFAAWQSSYFADDRHAEALELTAARCFEGGSFFDAFIFADRRRRLRPTPKPYVLVLLGSALARIGHEAEAARVFRDAFEVDPRDPLVIDHILLCADDDLRQRAARAAIASPRVGQRTFLRALHLLAAHGVSIAANLRAEAEMVEGWIAYARGTPAHALISMETGPSVQCDISRGGGAKGGPFLQRLALIKPNGPIVDVEIMADDGSRSLVTFRSEVVSTPRRPDTRIRPQSDRRPEPGGCTVIVPLYDDADITSRCLARLAVQKLADFDLSVILVNDRPDSHDIDHVAREASERHGFKLITNARNIGFLKTVNKGLDLAGPGDVLLLNSDVLLPPDAIKRMRLTAHAAADIGTVTPFANNGELTSYPVPNHPNPLPSDQDIDRLDRLASTINRGAYSRLPNGIGFCLYVRRDCLEAVGNLAECFLNGYFEDVDFCLRAEEKGFINVCACDVYVGHQGSSSFKDKKQALVARNLRVLTTRFPRYMRESRAFAAADPLAPFRLAIDLADDTISPPCILIAGRAADVALMARRAEHWRARGVPVRLLHLPGSLEILVEHKDGQRSRHLHFDVDVDVDMKACLAYIQRAAPVRVEVVDPVLTSSPLIANLRRGGASIVRLFDGSPIRLQAQESRTRACETLDDSKPCGECLAGVSGALQRSKDTRDRMRAADEVDQEAQPLLASNAMARAFARRLSIMIEDDGGVEPANISRHPTDGPAILGIVYPSPSVAVERLLVAICRRLALRLPALRIIIMGRALDDFRMMSAGTTVVTGPIVPSDHALVLRTHGIKALLGPERWDGFGLLAELAAHQRCPMAYFDWSFGTMGTADGDLAINPLVCDQKAAHQIDLWCQRLFTQARDCDT